MNPISWIRWGGKYGVKAAKHGAKTAAKHGVKAVKKGARPAIETIVAVNNLFEVHRNVTGNAQGPNNKDPAETPSEPDQKSAPSIQIIEGCAAYSGKIFKIFSNNVAVAGIGTAAVAGVVVYHGVVYLKRVEGHLKSMADSLAAATALRAQDDFAQTVLDTIIYTIERNRADPSREHMFWVYHPDTIWHPKFARLFKDKYDSVGPEFCGFGNQLDTMFAFMLAARQHINHKNARNKAKDRPIRRVKMHLLIPAYAPIFIADPVKIPEDIGDFAIEGFISREEALVHINLPKDQQRYLDDIGRYDVKDGWLAWAWKLRPGAKVPVRKILGKGGPDEAIPEPTSDAGYDEVTLARDKDQDRVTPLHRRYDRRERRGRDDEQRERPRKDRGTSSRSSRASSRATHRSRR